MPSAKAKVLAARGWESRHKMRVVRLEFSSKWPHPASDDALERQV